MGAVGGSGWPGGGCRLPVAAAAMNLICPLAKDSCLLLLALAVAAAAFNFQGKNIKISATKDHLSRILQQLQHSQLQLLDSSTFWYL